MIVRTPPTPPSYRVTLFFGPEPLDTAEPAIQCVFNVKKRSWKAGVQVSIHLRQKDLMRLRQRCAFDARFEPTLATVAEGDRDNYRERARDAFAVELARGKLDRAIEEGLVQENQTVPVGTREDHLDDWVTREAPSLVMRVAAELDLMLP